ncbi:hypothetical protein BCR35DRAFT_328140 [Leucosporidium creatinivorum]|uniref:Condensation domain-containing protein n=1 Tax=Leucosporidium creatinivorum TaxID=106004 RepID=A0A1Y2G2C4_9BASI|nr:hypothetical protein BCR35DRAFT_328140 [Leucosporidium creatinivorum]
MSRQFGLYERYSLARTLVGTAPILAFLVNLPETAKEVQKDDVELAVAELLRRYPILRCAVEGAQTREPRYVTNEKLSPSNVVEVREEDGERPEVLLRRGMEEGKGFDLEKGPLWKVVLFGEGKNVESKQRILLVLNHVLSDGTGTRNLFAELISLLHTPPSSPPSSKDSITTLPSTQESTVDLRPSYTHMARVIFAELIVPRLPAFLQSNPSPPCWPNPPLVKPLDQPTGIKHLSIPRIVVAVMKGEGQCNYIKTLHPILHTAAIASLVITLSKNGSTSLPPITGMTPLSIRTSALGHPSATGNYVDDLPSSSLSSSFSLDTPFWPACREYATQLVNRPKGQSGMGMLAFIPDPPLSGAEGEKTGFEKFVEEKCASQTPFSASFEVSNLGVLPPTGWDRAEDKPTGGIEVCWAQTATAFGPALLLNALTPRNGELNITLTWRKDAIPDEEVDAFWETYKKVLPRIASSAIGTNPTFGQMLE